MGDLEKAVNLLKEGCYTCVLVKGREVFYSVNKGIKPLTEFIESGKSFKGFCAADKIAGRAAAFLYAVMGVSGVHAEVLSEGAADVLKAHNIKYGFEVMTKNIINRRGDGLCPMESAVQNINDKYAAYNAVKEKMAKLRAENS